MVTFFLIGLVLGVGTGVPMGPVSVAVIGNAYRNLRLRAIVAGIGGAVADSIYAALGILGLGPLLARHPSLPPILYVVSGVFLIAYGIMTVKAKPPRPITADPERKLDENTSLVRGFAVGFGLIFMNPATMVTWVVVVGSFATGLTTAEGLSIVVGIGLGSSAWFSGVAVLAHRGKQRFGAKIAFIPRLVGVLLIGYGLFSLGRGAKHWLN